MKRVELSRVLKSRERKNYVENYVTVILFVKKNDRPSFLDQIPSKQWVQYRVDGFAYVLKDHGVSFDDSLLDVLQVTFLAEPDDAQFVAVLLFYPFHAL